MSEIIDLTSSKQEGSPLIVGRGLIRYGANIILLRKSKHSKYNSGVYVLPGGKADPDETALEAAKREILEETGLEAEPVYGSELVLARRMIGGERDGHTIETHFFGMVAINGVFAPEHVGTKHSFDGEHTHGLLVVPQEISEAHIPIDPESMLAIRSLSRDLSLAPAL